jgi:hypothetical protein
MTRPTTPRETIAQGIAREAAESAAREAATRKARAEARLRDTNAALRAQVESLTADLAAANTYADALRYTKANPLEPVQILPREKTSRAHEAIAVCVLSDLHLDESVDPTEINGINEYNPTIAAERMDRLAIGLVWQLELMRAQGSGAGYKIRDLLVPNLGDVTTNYLRAEDILGNAMTPMDGFVFAAGLEVRFLATVAERCPWLARIHCPRVPGNHDRMSLTPKTPYRKRVALSSAPLLAHMIASAAEIRADKRISIELSHSEHVYVDTYGKTLRGMHGDRFKYQGGIGGLFIPARRHIMGLNKTRKAEITIFGHWHTHRVDDTWISNGSLIGPNSYSIANGMDPEPAAQVFFLIDKNRGKRMITPLQVTGKDEWS